MYRCIYIYVYPIYIYTYISNIQPFTFTFSCVGWFPSLILVNIPESPWAPDRLVIPRGSLPGQGIRQILHCEPSGDFTKPMGWWWTMSNEIGMEIWWSLMKSTPQIPSIHWIRWWTTKTEGSGLFFFPCCFHQFDAAFQLSAAQCGRVSKSLMGKDASVSTATYKKEIIYGYGSIPIDTFLVGWTSIYQLFWYSLGTRVLTHPHISSSGCHSGTVGMSLTMYSWDESSSTRSNTWAIHTSKCFQVDETARTWYSNTSLTGRKPGTWRNISVSWAPAAKSLTSTAQHSACERSGMAQGWTQPSKELQLLRRRPREPPAEELPPACRSFAGALPGPLGASGSAWSLTLLRLLQTIKYKPLPQSHRCRRRTSPGCRFQISAQR